MLATETLDIVGHLKDSKVLEIFTEIELPHFEIFGIDMSITKHVVMMWIAAGLLILLLIPIARRRDLIPTGIKNLFESILVFIKDEIAIAQIGKKGIYFVPYLATLFLFILFCNLLGLVPFGSTATGNITVTASLALISFIVTHLSGIWSHGLLGYLKHLVPPVPWWLYPLMLFVELAGHIAKPIALAIRLFANMLGGHIVLLVILGFIFMFKNLIIASVSVGVAVALCCLEILVAFIQAYVFTFLTALFIGQAVQEEH